MKHHVNDAILYLYVIMYVLHNLYAYTRKCEKKYLRREVYMRHISNILAVFKTELKYKLSSIRKIYTQLSPCPQINRLPVFDRHFLATILAQINLQFD